MIEPSWLRNLFIYKYVFKGTPMITERTDRDGNTYVGQINSDRKKHGYGVFTFLNGQMQYKGQWDNNYMSGYGEMLWTDKHRYIGYWKAGQRSGYGIMIWPSGKRYQGKFISSIFSH